MGLENDSVVIYQVELFFDPGTQQAIQHPSIIPVYSTRHYGTLGKNEIANEILLDQTDFAKVELQKWISTAPQVPVGDRPVNFAIYLVQITITSHSKQGDVGGPIDALIVTKAGTRWVQRKPTCCCQQK